MWYEIQVSTGEVLIPAQRHTFLVHAYTHTHTHTHTPHRELLSDDPRFHVPGIIPELSTKRVLTAELIHGIPLDKCSSLSQETRNDASGNHPYHVTVT